MESRNTRQRENILDCLKKNAQKHLTIKDIEYFLKSTSNPVSITTIYRQLNKLSKMNLVRKIKLDGQNSACYQYIENYDSCCNHFHLICSKCSNTIHFQNEKLTDVFKEINKNNIFNIDYPKSVFYGICQKCMYK